MAAIDPDNKSEFVDKVAGQHHSSFSLYFVIFSTIFVMFLFFYALARLCKHCRNKRAQGGDFFCRAE